MQGRRAARALDMQAGAVHGDALLRDGQRHLRVGRVAEQQEAIQRDGEPVEEAALAAAAPEPEQHERRVGRGQAQREPAACARARVLLQP